MTSTVSFNNAEWRIWLAATTGVTAACTASLISGTNVVPSCGPSISYRGCRYHLDLGSWNTQQCPLQSSPTTHDRGQLKHSTVSVTVQSHYPWLRQLKHSTVSVTVQSHYPWLRQLKHSTVSVTVQSHYPWLRQLKHSTVSVTVQSHYPWLRQLKHTTVFVTVQSHYPRLR